MTPLIWVQDELRLAHGDFPALRHVHEDGIEHPSSITGDIRRCNHCGAELSLSVHREQLLDLVDALNEGHPVRAIILTVHLGADVLCQLVHASLIDVALRAIELEAHMDRPHSLALAA